MPLDGIVLSNVVHDLNELLGSRVDKIHQPEKEEIIIVLRGFRKNFKLLLSANPSYPRLHFTEQSKENPMQAPMFCMILRKHLNGKLVSVAQPSFERIVELGFETTNEMGDLCRKNLIIEIMGKHSNIILTDDRGLIIDSVKHITPDMSSVRQVLPNRLYVFPPSDKLNPLTDFEKLDSLMTSEPFKPFKNLIYQSFNGISPLIALELCSRAGVDPSHSYSMYTDPNSGLTLGPLGKTFAALLEQIRQGAYKNFIYYDESGKLFEFYSQPLSMYEGLEKREFEDVSKMLEAFYGEKDLVVRINQKSIDVRKLVSGNIDRCQKKKVLYMKTLEEIKDREKYRLFGELLTANIYKIQKGSSIFSAENFYNSTDPMELIDIPLEPELSPNENAQKYFKKYNKDKRTFKALQEQIVQNDQELEYLEGILATLQSCTDEADIEEIREELREQGFIKKRKQKSVKQKKSVMLKYKSLDGYDILVGKNNKQNDELTLRIAEGNDIWLHTKNIPGSHVLIRTNNTVPPPSTIEEAAMLAAYYSKARTGSHVPVDYTERKNVKKPNGAKPGFVIYETNKTAYITPDESALPKRV